MPSGDRTGPLGYGPMTGRGGGYCTGNRLPGFANKGFCRGLRRGSGGGGRGWRNTYHAMGIPRWGCEYNNDPDWFRNNNPASLGNFTPENEMAMLKNHADLFRKQIDVLNERIDELKSIASHNREAGDFSEK